jgi:uncharacterized protein (DUF433 family)
MTARPPRSGHNLTAVAGMFENGSRLRLRGSAAGSRSSGLWMIGSLDRPVAYPRLMSFERISIDPDRMQGLPCIRGTRVTVSAVLGQLAAGRSIDEVIEDYPQLERADVLGALEYAAAATRDREIPLTAAG